MFTKCPTDTFGSDCTSCTTRHCLGESDCPADGTCSQGCQDGWTGNTCAQKCPTDTFGSDCTSCTTRHCQGESDCPADGTCSQGCQDGWTSITCTQKCPADTFGSDCTSCTTRHCQGESDCPADGTCSKGCQDGWTGNSCTQECPTDTFGSDCTSCTTRYCQGESDCPVDGTCSQGCQDGWTGNSCTCKKGGAKMNSPQLINAYVIGAVVGLFMTTFLMGGIAIILKKRGRLYFACQPSRETCKERSDMGEVRSTGITIADERQSTSSLNKPYTQTGTATGDVHYESIQTNVYQNSLGSKGKIHLASRVQCKDQYGTKDEGGHYEPIG